jgi:hypothetical protein
LHANELAFHLVAKRSAATSGVSDGGSAAYGKSEINFLQELKIGQVSILQISDSAAKILGQIFIENFDKFYVNILTNFM